MAAKKKTVEEKEEAKVKKKAINKIPSRSERAQAAMDSFNAAMKGRAHITTADQYNLPFLYRRLPTGIASLDIALKGGFPGGGINQVRGPKNVGKDTIINMMIKQQQFYLGDDFMCFMGMSEMPWDRQQAKLNGVAVSLGDNEIEKLREARISDNLPDFTKEEIDHLRHQIGTFHELHADSAESLFTGILNAVESNAYHLIVINSFGTLLTAAQQEKEMGDKVYGGASGPITEFCKRLSNLLTMRDENGLVREVCIMGVNQVRDNLKDPDAGFRTTGGNALAHALYTDLVLSPGQWHWIESKEYTSNGVKTVNKRSGKDVNWDIVKGKAGMHEGARGTFTYDFRMNAVDVYKDILVAGVLAGFIQTSGAWISVPDPENPQVALLGPVQGKDQFIEALSANAQECAATGELSIMNRIREMLFKHHGINIKYNWKD